jgi:hypothetical protein
MTISLISPTFDTDPRETFSFEADLCVDGVDVARACYNGGRVRYYYNDEKTLAKVTKKFPDLDRIVINLAENWKA